MIENKKIIGHLFGVPIIESAHGDRMNDFVNEVLAAVADDDIAVIKGKAYRAATPILTREQITGRLFLPVADRTEITIFYLLEMGIIERGRPIPSSSLPAIYRHLPA